MRDVHIIHIDGRSYRLREIDGLLRPSNPTPSNCANLGVSLHSPPLSTPANGFPGPA